MSLLPRGYLATTVAIESAQEGREGVRYKTIGTGFFVALEYGDSSPAGEPNYRLFLATNRHVVMDRDELLIRVNAKEGAARRVRLAQLPDLCGRMTREPRWSGDGDAALGHAERSPPGRSGVRDRSRAELPAVRGGRLQPADRDPLSADGLHRELRSRGGDPDGPGE